MNEGTGEIVLRNELNYEKQTEHVLTLVAKDGGDEPATATSQVVVHVLDTNDNEPEISVSFADGEYSSAFVSGNQTMSVCRFCSPALFLSHSVFFFLILCLCIFLSLRPFTSPCLSILVYL